MTMSTRYEDLHSVLALALLKAQKGVEQLTLDDGSSVLIRNEANKGNAYEASFTTLSRSVAEKSNISSMMSDAAGSIFLPPKLEGIIPSRESDDIPDAADNVHPDLLNSGVAVYLGCCDKTRDAGVVLIYCQHPAWTSQYLTITNLTALLLYYQHLSRKQLTLIVDARDTTREVVRALLETISSLEVHGLGESTVDIVHILVDRISQALILRSPFFRNPNPVHSSQIDLLTNIDVMYRVVDRGHLPVELGGRLPPCHLRWVRFRQVYESLMNRCWEVVHILMCVAKQLSDSSSVTKSVTAEISSLISRHNNEVENLLLLPSVAALQSGEAERKLQRLRDDNIYLSHNSDYRESMEVIENLFAHLQELLDGLSRLSSMRIAKLNRCLKVRKFEDCYKQVVNSLAMINQEILTKYSMTASVGLQSLNLQQLEFNEVQMSAKAELSKADDLMELGRRMIETHDPWMVEVIERFRIDLQCRIDDLTQQLNQAKEKLDGMARCSQLLDKSYEWTQNAMKFVAEVDPPLEQLTLCDLGKSISDLERCLWEQPLSSMEEFQIVLEDCRRLGTLRLVERCIKVQNQHKEAVELIKIRKDKLLKHKEQLQREKCLHRRPHLGSLTSFHDYEDSLGFLRRRSYAGKPSTPMYSPHVEAFKRKDMDIQEYEEYLFSEGLITDDMSERIVTSLPKGLSDMTMRGSRESLRSSKESLHESQECVLIPCMSQESLNSCSSVFRDQKSSNLSTNKPRGKPWKMFKKAVSFLMDSNTQTSNLYNSSPPGLSLSSESLEFNPKRAEGELGRRSSIAENGFSWYHTSHSSPLMYRNPNAESIEHQSISVTAGKDSKDAKRMRILSHIMSEMIKTEKDYVSALKFVIENYLPELNRDDVVQPLRGKRNIVFGNLEKIYEFHSQKFLQELELCHETPLHVGATFLRNASDFYLYALYNKNKPKSDALMKDCGTAFFTRKQRELGEKLDLNSYLLKPVQRMGKYALLLEELIKECPASVTDYGVLKDALEMVRFQLRHGNDLLAMDCIRHCDVSLQEQGRLLLQDSFTMTQGRRKSERHVFLFEEMILFTKPRRRGSGIDWLDYKTSYKMSDVGLTENVNDERKFEIWFRKRSPDVTFVLEAPSADVKRLWITCLSRLLWKQAIRNRQRRRNELSDMGHGWKPGEDLRRSNNYIQDHAICLASHQTMSKVRNSIAVASFEHCKAGNKRPHSMISVTSSSSSGSSHSSGYPCSLSTTFEMPFETADVQEDAATQTTFRPTAGYLTAQWPCDVADAAEGQITRV